MTQSSNIPFRHWNDGEIIDWIEECIKGIDAPTNYGDCLIWDVTRSPNNEEWDITLIFPAEVILVRTVNSAEWPMSAVMGKIIKRLPYTSIWGRHEPMHTINLVQHAATSE